MAVLDDLAQQREPYPIDGCLHVDVVDDSQESSLFLGWKPQDIQALEPVLGHRPTWHVMIHLSWTVEAPTSARRLTLALLYGGRAAHDDYSHHPWTAEQIDEDRTVHRRRFRHPSG